MTIRRREGPGPFTFSFRQLVQQLPRSIRISQSRAAFLDLIDQVFYFILATGKSVRFAPVAVG